MDLNIIIPSLISAGVTLIICLINNKSQSDKTRALMEYRLEQLEKKMDKHNNLLERVFKIEEQNTVTDEKIKSINHRLDDLEKGA